MSIHTFSSREFTRDVGAAKRAAASGPVFITDRGKPRYVEMPDATRAKTGHAADLQDIHPLYAPF